MSATIQRIGASSRRTPSVMAGGPTRAPPATMPSRKRRIPPKKRMGKAIASGVRGK
jgi:hypothetical protein